MPGDLYPGSQYPGQYGASVASNNGSGAAEYSALDGLGSGYLIPKPSPQYAVGPFPPRRVIFGSGRASYHTVKAKGKGRCRYRPIIGAGRARLPGLLALGRGRLLLPRYSGAGAGELWSLEASGRGLLRLPAAPRPAPSAERRAPVVAEEEYVQASSPVRAHRRRTAKALDEPDDDELLLLMELLK